MAAEDHLLIRHMSELIQKVTMVKPALDLMRQMKLLTIEQYNLATSKDTTQEQMRELYRHVIQWSWSQLDDVSVCLTTTNPVVMENIERGTQAVRVTNGMRDGQNTSICLDRNTGAVELSREHNCRACIKDVLHEQVASEAYTGPKCKRHLKVKKVVKTRNIVEDFPLIYPESGETGIFSTNSNETNALADKSCLVRENLRKEQGTSAGLILPESINSTKNRTNRVQKNFTDTAQVFNTRLDRGSNSNQVEACTNGFVKDKLISVQKILTIQQENTEERLHGLLDHEREVKEKAADIERRINVLFKDIRNNLEVLEERVLSEISVQENQVSRQVSSLTQHLGMKKDELFKKMHSMKELCKMSDSVPVLQELDLDGFYETHELDIDNILVHGVRDLDEGLISAIFHTGLSDIITGIKRGIYVQELSEIFLDVNTAENHINISDDLKTVSWSQINKQRPDIPERFDHSQVLSTRGFSSGLNYWEVEVGDRGAWRIGMSYSSVSRKGKQGSVGSNNKSWCLCRWYNNMCYAALHNSEAIELVNISSKRFGIYLNYEAGQLSFYALCHPARHLHTFRTTFTEPLHAAIYVWDRECDKDCWVRIRSYEK